MIGEGAEETQYEVSCSNIEKPFYCVFVSFG